LVGKIIKEFQELEESLAFLVYFSCYNKSTTLTEKEARGEAILQWNKMQGATLGQRMKKIKELRFFEEENDIIVLDFLTEKRNYIAHRFFTENSLNSFATQKDIAICMEELGKISQWSELINEALKKMVNFHFSQLKDIS